jgi:glycosyltransferase involved in cell wall biosynthesis
MPYAARLVMLGAPPETRGSIAAVVETCRQCGLFRRWPIRYVPASNRLALKAARSVVEELARGRAAVHAHVAVRGFWRSAALLAPAFALRAPVLLQLHGAGFERFYDDCGPLARAAITAMLEKAAGVLVPTEAMRAWVRSVAHNAHAVYLPVPVLLESAAKDPAKPNMVLFLDRMSAENGIFDLLEAVASLRGKLADVRLVCAGDGERVAVARYAESLGIADSVKFTGWVGPSGKRALFESAAVLAAPAYDAALPMSVLEAMAAGVPVVASAVGGIPEAVVDGVTGFLVAPGDSASLARVLRKLLAEREAGAAVAAAARESVRLRFAAERALPRLEEMYRALGLAETGAPSGPQADLRKAA